jgi:hypothetical protein
VSPEDVLAEGEELSSNPLRAFFNDLCTTLVAVELDWRIVGYSSVLQCNGRRAGARAAKTVFDPDLERAPTSTSWCAATPPPEIRSVFSSTAAAHAERSPRSTSYALADA